LPTWSIPAIDDHERFPKPDRPLPKGKVCIIGAGIAGLYLAMLLDQVKVPYDIVDASSRIGGRVFTYEFPTNDPRIRHNYYDVGAMRFPHLKTMDP
jgi:cation diffusion facilitator CzcD-associated flavoprotein CzcO